MIIDGVVAREMEMFDTMVEVIEYSSAHPESASYPPPPPTVSAMDSNVQGSSYEDVSMDSVYYSLAECIVFASK